MVFNFDGIVSEMKARLSLLSNWNTTLYFGVYQRLIDTVSYISEKIVQVAEVYYREANWSTAQLNKSLSGMAWMLGYTPHRKSGATGSVIISDDPTLDPTHYYLGVTVDIQRWQVFYNSSKTSSVYATEIAQYQNGELGPQTVYVKEGTPKQFTYVATGVANEVITIYSDSVDETEIEMFVVDGLGITLDDVVIVPKMYFIDDLVTYNCQVDTIYDFSGITITFGDGINSRKLVAGERILIKYAETKGALGNIESTNIINTINGIIYDNAGNSVTLYVTNTDVISDGADWEGLEEIRNKAPRLFYSGYRCADLSDWKAILESFPTVYLATVWTDNTSIFFNTQNVVSAVVVSASGDDLSQPEKNAIILALTDNYKSPTEIIDFNALEKIYIAFDITAKISSGTHLDATNAIKTLLNDTYGVLNTTFQQNVYPSMFVGKINEVPQVLYHSTTIKLMEQGMSSAPITPHQILVYNQDDLKPENCVRLTAGSVELWLKWKGEITPDVWEAPKQIATTVSGNLITGINGYTISNGTISSDDEVTYRVEDIITPASGVNYGEWNPTDSDPVGYVLSLCYTTQDGNGDMPQAVRMPGQNQITDIDTDYIFTTMTYV